MENAMEVTYQVQPKWWLDAWNVLYCELEPLFPPSIWSIDDATVRHIHVVLTRAT